MGEYKNTVGQWGVKVGSLCTWKVTVAFYFSTLVQRLLAHSMISRRIRRLSRVLFSDIKEENEGTNIRWKNRLPSGANIAIDRGDLWYKRAIHSVNSWSENFWDIWDWTLRTMAADEMYKTSVSFISLDSTMSLRWNNCNFSDAGAWIQSIEGPKTPTRHLKSIEPW
jgi:hypothetical protein